MVDPTPLVFSKDDFSDHYYSHGSPGRRGVRNTVAQGRPEGIGSVPLSVLGSRGRQPGPQTDSPLDNELAAQSCRCEDCLKEETGEVGPAGVFC